MVNLRAILQNISWAMAGKMANLLSGLFVAILVARYLGPESFGIYNYVIAFVMMFSVVSNFGLENVEIREMSKCEESINEILGTSFVIRVVMSMLTVVLVSIVACFIEDDNDVVVLMMCYSSTLLLNSFRVIRNYFTSILLNKFVVKSEITRTLIGILLKLLLIIYNAPIDYFVYALVFDIFMLGAGYVAAHYRYRGSLKSWKYSSFWAKKLIVESFPFLLSGTVIAIYQRVDSVFIKNLLDSEHLGYFSAANKIVDVGMFLPLVVCQTVTPVLVRKRRDSPTEYFLLRQKFLDFMTWGGGLASFVISFFSYYLITVAYGSAYAEGIVVLRLLSWKIMLASIFAATAQIILIEEIQKWAVLRNLIGLLFSVSLNYILIPVMGVFGSAIAAIVTLVFSGIVSHAIIPSYRPLFGLQLRSFLFGLKTVFEKKYLVLMKSSFSRKSSG